MRTVVVATAALLTLTGCAPTQTTSSPTSPAATTLSPAVEKPARVQGPPLAAHVTKAQLGKDWPFVHITAGWVRCIPNPSSLGKVIFTADGNGRTFGLNGTALEAGYKDIPASEWRKNADIPGAGVSVAPLRDPVAKACGL